jgi:hypothetical protein
MPLVFQAPTGSPHIILVQEMRRNTQINFRTFAYAASDGNTAA